MTDITKRNASSFKINTKFEQEFDWLIKFGFSVVGVATARLIDSLMVVVGPFQRRRMKTHTAQHNISGQPINTKGDNS